MTPLLVLEGVSVHYGRLRALTDVSLVVPEGCVVALLGANGAGKTTTLRTISGLVRPSSGRICLAGRRIDGRSPHAVARLGALHVPEGRGVFPGLSVRENLEMASRSTGQADQEEGPSRGVELFPVLGGHLDQAAGTLSGGEQQMLALARALVAEPRLVMLDEISTGLAPRIVAQLFDAVRELAQRGTTVLLVEQHVEIPLGLADYVYLLEGGAIVDVGEPADLRRAGVAGAYLG